MAGSGDRIHQHWDWRRRSLAAVLWPSFLVAAVATMVCFAFIEPERLLAALEYPVDASAMTVYSLGFFLFWTLALVSSTLTAWLIRTERRLDQFPDG